MDNQIVVVSCYGLMHEGRTKKEIEGYDAYIRSFSEYLSGLKNKPKAIIFAGGRTNPELSAESESESVLRYVLDNELLPDQHLLVETTSHTSYEQIVFGVAHVRKLISEESSLLFICDTPRLEKMSVEASVLLGDYFDIDVQAFDRPDAHPHSDRDIQIYQSLPDDLKSKQFEFLKEYIQEMMLAASFVVFEETVE